MNTTDDIKKNIDSAKAVYAEGGSTRKKWLILGVGFVSGVIFASAVIFKVFVR